MGQGRMRGRLGVRLIPWLLLGVGPARGGSDVKVWEEPLVLPTYRVGAPDPNPRFYAGRTHQGAQGRVYPYPMRDVLTDERAPKTYRALYLENDYLKLCVLPELGGRLFAARDKTNGYDFFYRQHVVKPVLIGMLGAWISGGVEWNVPHHHRATTVMPVDWTFRHHADGSATIWVGELEIRHRMRWAVGLTLHPDRSFIECTGRLWNRTPFVNSILFWANAAVHANENYQVIFPPSTEYVVQHAKRESLPWPIAKGRYGGHRYENVDIRWYKNLPKPVSFFAWNDTEDYFGGYDHGKEAGVVLVADHHIVPGKKFWTFACGTPGRMWDKMLTDEDGPYIELMAGAYSDNQPDYSWCQPYETKTFREYWFPIRRLGGLKYANLEGALNLEVAGGVAKIRVNTTTPRPGARVLLCAGSQPLFERTSGIDPASPFAADVALPSGTREADLEVRVLSGDGGLLMRYRPVARPGRPMPKPVAPPRPPKAIETVEELYFTGQRLEQFHNAARDAAPYYEEALRRDPGDSRAHTALGISLARRGRFREAEAHLTRALERLTRNYTRPKDCEAYYYLGVVRRALGEWDAAYDAFHRATWDFAWSAAGWYALAEIDCLRGDGPRALAHLDRALATNAQNTEALSLRALVLLELGRLEEAEAAARHAEAIDPLDTRSRYAHVRILAAMGEEERAKRMARALKARMRDEVQSYLELMVSLANAGLDELAVGAMPRIAGEAFAEACPHPMVHYWLGYLYDRMGDEAAAAREWKKGASLPPRFCFPFRLESIDVLERALAFQPGDARGHYYLGNLLYDIQPERAIPCWERSRARDPTYVRVHRNLGFAYAQIRNDLGKAIACMERAIACDATDPRLYYEIDGLYEAAKVPVEKRLALFEANLETVRRRDDATGRLARLYVQAGRLDDAIHLLASYHFHRWEGGGRIHDVFEDAHLLRGWRALRGGRPREARRDFEAALTYPRNLEVGKPVHDVSEARTRYFIGLGWKALGDRPRATREFEAAARLDLPPSDLLYFQGLALRELGREKEARTRFDRLIAAGEARLEAGGTRDFFEKFGERRSRETRRAEAHYLAGLGHLGLGDRDAAAASFRAALAVRPAHIWARAYLAAAEQTGRRDPPRSVREGPFRMCEAMGLPKRGCTSIPSAPLRHAMGAFGSRTAR